MIRRPTLIFEGGSLAIEAGSGTFGFEDDDVDYEPHGKETYRFIKLPRSELIALRDFLIKEIGDG